MPAASHHRLIITTAPDQSVAREIATNALGQRLAACVNLIPAVESWYWWNEKIENNTEIWLAIKTVEEKVAELEDLIIKLHPYDTPAFICVPIESGNQRYLDWITANVHSHAL